jgi:protein kinase A
LHHPTEGGELYKLSKDNAFKEDVTKFYAASVVLAFEELHDYMIAYRDLKPVS